jgi:hypothetical protein
MSSDRKHFVSEDGKIWIQVCCYDDRGDPYPPNNFRPELYPSTVEYAGSSCYRVDEAWRRAHATAEKYGLKQTEAGKEAEASSKEWAKENFKIEW